MVDQKKRHDPPREPTEDRLTHMRWIVIPHILMSIRQAAQALELERQHGILAFVTVKVDATDTPAQRTLLGAYTQPIIAMGVLRCRYLLEFLGIKTTGAPPTLRAIDRRRNGDVGVEHFTSATGTRLSRVTPDGAASLFRAHVSTPRAWATVIEIANQRLAHPTDDYKLSGTSSLGTQLQTTFSTIPELVYVKFYDALGVERPKY
ncbi:hypothetical protein R69608_01399 [Paraburkholderia nemoris]|uniref:hypothetical protein n=1 Tax=Paraburkholderia nemoris TaxID=2793076 RepID=UPI0019118937|nr:hypothetical protein [Paraburkholderia nemoris]MBK5148025.1 hypothetical protein [Burkholderia sp. R-69608]CAE6875966.1 hypothetical protein R69608_01399 [Paraburkholderia nemoris]